MADFISLSALKTALDVTDASLDTLLSGLSATATDMLIDYMNRDPRADDFVERADGFGTRELLVNQYPINTVSSITVTRTAPAGTMGLQPAALPVGAFDWDSNLIWRTDGSAFPRGRRNVLVSYNAGLDPMPKSIAQAAVYTVRALLTARKLDLNATSESWAGVSSQAWNPSGPGTVPQAAKTLLANYVRLQSF